jgi:hypothetical protein
LQRAGLIVKQIPDHYKLMAAKVDYDGCLLDVYIYDGEDDIELGAVCLTGTKFDLFDLFDGAVQTHFCRLVDNYNPAQEARFERAMERAASALLGCPA